MSKPDRNSLSDRMKDYYENAYRFYLPRRMPFIIRLDGVHFHTFTKDCNRPFDQDFANAMLSTTKSLCEEIQGVKLAYWQSDEISLLLTDYDTLQTQAWFGKNIQKMTSVSASLAAAYFNDKVISINNSRFEYRLEDKFVGFATFDSRTFVLPKEEVCNYFLDRQQDASRNSINSLGQSKFSVPELHGQNTDQVQEMLFKHFGINWDSLPTIEKRGACVVKNADEWEVDKNIPLFSQERDYINKHVFVGE